jgi:hypothetical protein
VSGEETGLESEDVPIFSELEGGNMRWVLVMYYSWQVKELAKAMMECIRLAKPFRFKFLFRGVNDIRGLF